MKNKKSHRPPGRDVRKKQLKILRRMCETSEDCFVARMAQAMEYAIIWATEWTEGWYPPPKDAAMMADILRKDILRKEVDGKIYVAHLQKSA